MTWHDDEDFDCCDCEDPDCDSCMFDTCSECETCSIGQKIRKLENAAWDLADEWREVD